MLRLGRSAAQRWLVAKARNANHAGGTGLVLIDSSEFPADAWTASSDFTVRPELWPTAALMGALSQLYPIPPQGGLEVVLESTWLPVMLAETGGALVSESEALALLRHRLAQKYDSPDDPVASWEVRVSFEPGEALALGYGLSPQVSGALNQAAAHLGLKYKALTPALAWGWQRATAAGCFSGEAIWWGWQEQDRLLLGRVEGKNSAVQLKSLHPGLAWGDQEQHWVQMAQAEAQRLGLSQVPRDMQVGVWTPQGCRFIKQSCNISP